MTMPARQPHATNLGTEALPIVSSCQVASWFAINRIHDVFINTFRPVT
jgi:hypothetical protein